MPIEESIRKYALENAIHYNGRANSGSVIGKLISEDPELKKKMGEIGKKVAEIIKLVNAMNAEDQLSELQETAPELLEKKEKEKKDDLKELDEVDPVKGVIMRFAPSPSGPMHIGHAMTGGITSLYIKKYGGKFILRIEDTNSNNIDPIAYDMLPSDGKWIFGNVTDIWIQSDRMQIYYDYIKKLLDLHTIYVCTCSQEEFKKHSDNIEDCPCRDLTIKENFLRWNKMFDKQTGFKEGEVVIRFKSGMQDKNPAMRDFPLARINDSVHPRQGSKYRVWPLMNLCVTVDDIEAGMTHIIRAKDHADNAKRQEKIYNVLGIKFPKTYFVGRYNFEGLEISCSKTKARILAGEFSGWDDIRVPFLTALKRRGYQPEAFLKYTKLNGLSPVDKTVPAEEFFKSINAFNKEIIDTTAKRFFMIKNPAEIKIENAPEQKIELDLHPENIKGGRNFITTDTFIIEKHDIYELNDNGFYRLMDAVNFTKDHGKYKFHSTDYMDFKEKGKKIIHWLPKDDEHVKITVLMPDNITINAIAEKSLKQLKVGEIIQFERFGFCRLDSIVEHCYNFWFTHK